MKHIDHKMIILALLCVVASVAAAIYYSNPFKGIMHGILFGLPITLICVLIIAVFQRLINSKIIVKVLYIFIGALAIISLILFHRHDLIPSSTELFARIFKTLQPTSVTDVELSVSYPGQDLIFRMKFSIDEEHFEPLLTAFKEDKPWRSLTTGVLNSRDSLLSYLQVVWLKPCGDLPWWHLDSLAHLPQYRWDDEDLWRRMWFEQPEDGGKYIVYVAGAW